MYFHPVFQRDREMPFVILAAPESAISRNKRQFGKDGHAIVAFLTGDCMMCKAHFCKGFEGKFVVCDLGFLKAENVGLVLCYKLFHMGKDLDRQGGDAGAGEEQRNRDIVDRGDEGQNERGDYT